MENVSIKIKNYKCFDSSFQGFDKIKPINIAIGRNNSGKSALLELLSNFINHKKWFENSQDTNNTAFRVIQPITGDMIRAHFHPGTSGGGIEGDHYRYGQNWIDCPIKYTLSRTGRSEYSTQPPIPTGAAARYFENMVKSLTPPLINMTFASIQAERSILPEAGGPSEIKSNGQGATTIIQNFINDVNLDSKQVEDKLLAELNKIINPDCNFTDIVVQRLANNSWEIFLEEKTKGRIALSASGSGLQTIILVLINLHLLPILKKQPLSNFIFCFEELENNLHPSLQRRLFAYLRSFIKAGQPHPLFFITTHSNVVIDLFANEQAIAQLLHVQNTEGVATVNPLDNYSATKDLISDLGYKASDLLQANCIIWVEGPSDRIYFNKWISLWAPELKEGYHYQCVFYGGRLLSHLSFEEVTDDIESFIQTLRVNSNAVVIIDSDKKDPASPINQTKIRIENEITESRGYCWITEGREIENYIPDIVLSQVFPTPNISSLKKFEDIGSAMAAIEKQSWFENNKVKFAQLVITKLSKQVLSSQYDLNDRMNAIVEYIRHCN